MKLRARKELAGSTSAGSFSWVVPGQGDAEPSQSCPCHLHPSSVADRLAEPAGCRVLSCCPLVVLQNVGPSQFHFPGQGQRRKIPSLEQDNQPRRPHHSLSQAAVGLAVQQKN